MIIDVTFEENEQSFNPDFGEVINLSESDRKAAYEEGYTAGETDGYAKGHADGVGDGVEMLARGDITQFVSDTETMKPWALASCSKLQTVSVPNLKIVPERCFASTDLRSVILEGAEELKGYAFYLCYNLNIVDLPKVTKIGQMVFGYNYTKSLILRNEDAVCTLEHVNAFTGGYIASGKGYIYVPDSLVEQYKVATNWSSFANLIKPISELEG